MSRYFIDTEFHEGFHKPLFGRKRHFIDLISIALVSQDGREYYAISKDFDIDVAWNSYQWKSTGKLDLPGIDRSREKEYWLRENVLMPVFFELALQDFHSIHYKDEWCIGQELVGLDKFRTREDWSTNLKWFKKLIKKYGKSNEQIAEEIRNFVYAENYDKGGQIILGKFFPNEYPSPEFYGYYADYDWVLFCSLFGRMIDLPTGFPMYCRDLKQISDEAEVLLKQKYEHLIPDAEYTIKNVYGYPKAENEHSSLFDARFNRDLYKFIQSL